MSKKTRELSDSSKILGQLGEHVAEKYLISKGLLLVTRNWRCRLGEIDLIFWDGAELVFVEVKTRLESREAKRYLLSSIDFRKRKKLQRLVNFYLYRHYWRRPPPHRVDAVGVIVRKAQDEVPIIRHLCAVVRVDD